MTRRPLPDRATPETRQERISNLETLTFEALRDARMAASSGLPNFEDIAQASAARLRQELHRREQLLHLEEMSNSGLRHSLTKNRQLARNRLVKLKSLQHLLRNVISKATKPDVPTP